MMAGLILTTTLDIALLIYSHFKDEETEAQSDSVTQAIQ